MKSRANGFRKKSLIALILEATSLKILCEKDREELIAAKLPWSLYEKLQQMIAELSSLNGKVLLYREDCKYETSVVKDFAKECSKLRSKLRSAINEAFELAESEKRIPGLSQKKSYIDISQDLMDLAVTAERIMAEEPEYFTETEMVLNARTNSEKLRKMACRKEVSFNPNNELPESGREKALLINKIMKKIRIYGRRAFANDPKRRSAYNVK